MNDCLRAYAECLQVEADLMIEDYVRERDRCLQQLAAAIPDTPPSAVGRHRSPRWLAVAVVCVGLVVAAWWIFFPNEPAQATDPQPAPAAAAPIEIPPTPGKAVVSSSTNPADTIKPPKASSRSAVLQIPDYGVGTGVRDRQLVGRGDRFVEGSRLWFWTRVEGARPGDRIDHVWLREGVEAARISLDIGGTRWRTHSNKTLHAGAVGDWVVEARDRAGRVLARAEFTCVP